MSNKFPEIALQGMKTPTCYRQSRCSWAMFQLDTSIWAVGSHPGPIRYTPSGPSGIPAHPDSIRIWPIRDPSGLYVGHRTVDIVRWTSYVGHRTVDIIRRTSYVGHRTVDIVRWTSYVGHRTLDIVRWTLYGGQRIMDQP